MRLRLSWLLAWMLACTVEEADDDDTSDGPSSADDDDDDDGDDTIDPTTPTDGSDPSTDSGAGTSATSTPTDTSTTADSSAEDPSDEDASDTAATTDASSSTGDGHNDACVAGCMIEFACQDTCECDTTWKSEDACVQWCEANLEKAATFTEFCRDAWENMSACIGTLDCDGYHEFHNPAVPDYPCVSEADSLAFECKGQ